MTQILFISGIASSFMLSAIVLIASFCLLFIEGTEDPFVVGFLGVISLLSLLNPLWVYLEAKRLGDIE